MANEIDEDKTQTHHFKKSSKNKENYPIDEIDALINEPEFADFVQTISESIDDNITFNELLSSKKILQRALKILQKNQG